MVKHKSHKRHGFKTFIKEKWHHFISQPVSELNDRSIPFSENLRKLTGNGNSSFYRLLFAVSVIFLLFFMPAISFDFGRNSDETVSNNYGKDILNYYQTGGKDKSVFNTDKQGYNHMIYYGLSFDFICAVVNKFISPFGEFETRHILNALLGLLAMIFAALVARRLANWRAAFLTLAFMFLTPTFLGHSMNNAKDIPFAAGYIMAVYFLIRLLQTFPSVRFMHVIWLCLSIGFTGSNKINGWVILTAYLLFFLFVIILYQAYQKRDLNEFFTGLKKYAVPVLFILIVSYLLSIAFWPYAYTNIFRRPLESIKTFENVGSLMIHYELFAGKLINMENVPWYYTFEFMFVTLPLFVLSGFLITVLGFRWLGKKFNLSLIGLLLFVTFAPVLYTIYKHSTLYNGWRHFLFIYPSFAVLSVTGWEYLLQSVNNKLLKYSVSLILLLMILKTTVWAVINHPNEIVYYNELTGGVKGAYGNYELDPLATSGKQAIEWLIKKEIRGNDTTVVMSNIEGESLQYYANKKHKKVRVYWTKGMNTSQVDWKYLVLLNTGLSHTQLTSGAFPPKGTIHLIKAGNRPLIAIVKKTNNCKFIGYWYFQKDIFDSAVIYYLKAYNYDSNDVEAMDMLAASYINMKFYREALTYLNKSLNLFPEDFYAWENVGVIYMFKQDYPRAIRYLRKAISYRVNAKTALMNLGKSFYNVGEPDSALYYFTQYDLYYPRDVELITLVAQVYKSKGDLNKALQVYNKALLLRPADKNLAAQRDEIISAMSSGQFKSEFVLAMKYAQSGKIDSTINILSRIIKEDSGNYTAWINRGVAWFQSGKIQQAFNDFDRAIELKPDMPDGYFKKGQIYAVTKNYKAALDNLNIAVKLSPDNFDIYLERGNVYFNSKNYQTAIEDYSRAITLKQDFDKAYYSRGMSWYELMDYGKALDDMNEAIHFKPDYYDAYQSRAVIFYALKKYREAAQDIRLLRQNNFPVDEKLETDVNKMLH